MMVQRGTPLAAISAPASATCVPSRGNWRCMCVCWRFEEGLARLASATS